MSGGTQSFDRLGARYDATRSLPPDLLRAALDAGLAAAGAPTVPRILECGCGTGQVLVTLLASERLVVGVDTAQTALRVARERLSRSAVLVVADGRALPFPDGEFDVAVVAHVLEHVPEWRQLLRECLRVASRRLVLLFSPGFIRNTPRSMLKDELRASGIDLRRAGVDDKNELQEFFRRDEQLVVEQLRDEQWRWRRDVRIGDALGFLRDRSYSAFWSVPDDTYDAAVERVALRMSGRENDFEQVNAALEVWAIKAA